MRIGILTQPLTNNYGGILQNYALQNTLKKLNHNPITINIPYPLNKGNNSVLKQAWRYVKHLRGDNNIIFYDAVKQINFKNTPGIAQSLFFQKYLNILNVDKIDNNFCTTHSNFDAFVVGSDQVWRKAFSPNLWNYFLDFVPNNKLKIAYAASFGGNQLDVYDQEELQKCSLLAQRFQAISVREKSGIDICKKQLDVEATWVLDPTMLLEADEYLNAFKIKDCNSQDIVAVYILDYHKDITTFVNRIAKRYKLQPVYIGWCTKTGFQSIEDWIETIAKAKFVITDSFHGTVFSMLFQKQFYTIANIGRGLQRFLSLFDSFELSSNLLYLNDIKNGEITPSSIDYERVNILLKTYRELSISFLKSSLSQ